ncbi:hypothetical protein BJF95_20855 [Rhizobium oryziradicis]|uniref:DUF2865 domain-containing protein n=2 Tax=Rhizobium oryziradicis TaxID=1867956 RepID=A0A1Q8ZN73_9HYPH|nr:hypothetical protein BJF95_20855 [Rhizobium oryziradicis]
MRTWVKLMIASSFGSMALNLGAMAQANETCEALRAELAQTPITIGSMEDARLFAGAVTRQSFEIRKVQQNMQNIGCSSSVSVLDASGHDMCQDMQATVDAMQANKQKLSQQRDAANSKGGINPRRKELQAALRANACDAEKSQPSEITADAADEPRPFEAPVYPEYSGPATLSSGILRGEVGQPYGQSGYRTLCVRSCDGAFFPISPSTPPADFGRDAAQCQRMCPGTQTELYYSRLNQEAEDMVSTITGQPYRDMPNAFAYRNRRPGKPGQCGCSDVAAPPLSTPSTDAPSVISIRTIPAEKPKDIASPPVQQPQADKNADKDKAPLRVYNPDSAHIRQVGPTFFPTANKSLDLKHPALEGPQPLQ